MADTEKIAIILCMGTVVVLGALFFEYSKDIFLTMQNHINTSLINHYRLM
jgi:hypothetical protein